jgi:hypothetical protein
VLTPPLLEEQHLLPRHVSEDERLVLLQPSQSLPDSLRALPQLAQRSPNSFQAEAQRP